MLIPILLAAFSLLYFFCIPGIVILVIVLAASGQTLGIRELVAKLLVTIFEWGAEIESDHIGGYANEDDDFEEQRKSGLKKRWSSSDLRIIKRDRSDKIDSKLHLEDQPKSTSTVSVVVDDSLDFITAGVESIIEDQVTSRFSAEKLPSWNLLSRTKYSFEHISVKLTVLWLIGFCLRYLFLVPIRLCLFTIGMILMVITTSTIGHIPNEKLRKWVYRRAMLMSFRIFARSFSSIVRFHHRENRADHGGICVANHTSPMDVMILSTDNCYAMVGQKQGGFLGFLETSLAKAEHHIWFERNEAGDRLAVVRRMKEHVDDPTKLPIIIFPEGTCINNTGVMMFKKGSFEISATIFPIAMKYDSRLGDAFWNSSEQSYGEYLWMMMTSWAIICDVWYLPPMTREEGEDSISFARRVKKAIAKAGGLVDLEWDGALKREKVSNRLINVQQKLYAERLAAKTSLYQRPTEEELDILKKLSSAEKEDLLQNLEEHDDDQAILRKVSKFVTVPEVEGLQAQVTEQIRKAAEMN